jgi:hypothetical protein
MRENKRTKLIKGTPNAHGKSCHITIPRTSKDDLYMLTEVDDGSFVVVPMGYNPPKSIGEVVSGKADKIIRPSQKKAVVKQKEVDPEDIEDGVGTK